MSEKTRMSLADLERTPEFKRLTPKQKFFVQNYVGGGETDGTYDPIAATAAACECKSEHSVRVRSYGLLENINVVACLNRHFGNEPIDAFLISLERAVRNKKLTLAQLGALRLQCEVLGFKTKLPGPFESFPSSIPKRERKPRKTPKPKKTPEPSPSTPRVGYDPSQF